MTNIRELTIQHVRMSCLVAAVQLMKPQVSSVHPGQLVHIVLDHAALFEQWVSEDKSHEHAGPEEKNPVCDTCGGTGIVAGGSGLNISCPHCRGSGRPSNFVAAAVTAD